MNPALIYLCDANAGGIYQYARHQAPALAQSGLKVHFLCREDYPGTDLPECTMERQLPRKLHSAQPRWRRAVRLIRDERIAAERTAALACRVGASTALQTCYREYLSPFWAGAYRRAEHSGIHWATIAHDPVRDFVVGPRWWHRWSVRQAYSFISRVFMHDDTPLDTGGARQAPAVTIIPHGPYPLPSPRVPRSEMRNRLGLSGGDRVFLAFGHLRDGKNLDLFIQTMAQLPTNCHLLVVGQANATSQKPGSYYQELAKALGVALRCHWILRYVDDQEAADYFAASDICLLSYNARYHSASGVLSLAAEHRKPVLASSGAGPLKQAVQDYALGEWVEPDQVTSLVEGARGLLQPGKPPEWDRFSRDHSWARNARLVNEALMQPKQAG